MKGFIEDVLSQTITEIGESAVGRRLQEVESAKEAESGIISQGGSQMPIRFHLSQIDQKLCLK